MGHDYVPFETLLGKVFTSVTNHGDEEIVFITQEGEEYRLHHHDD